MIGNKIILLLLISFLFASCIKEPDANGANLIDDFDRKAMLENMADNFIIPGYQNYVSKINLLEQSILTFETTQTLGDYEIVLSNYQLGIKAWQAVSFLEFGPAENIVLRGQSNVYPVDTALIQSNINLGGYNLATAGNYAAKGWQALDYLLYFSEDDTVSTAYFVNNSPALDYLKNSVIDLKANADYVNNAWQTYRNTFVNNNANNANGSAVSDLTNAIVSHYEAYVRKGKVGLPVGAFNGFSQTPMPQNVEGLYQHAQLQFATTTMVYFKRFLNGQHFNGNSDALGLLDYANFVGATVDGKEISVAVNAQIERILIANENVIGAWSEMVQQNPGVSQEIYLEYQKLTPLIKVDLTSALGIIITYQDNDGD